MGDPVGNGTGKGIMLLVAMVASSLFSFMFASVNIALPSIGIDLSLDAITLGWVATAFILSSAALLVPFGRIADIYGRKRIFTGGITIFTIASLLCGMATSGAMLISFRVLQGVGCAMLVGSVVALLTSVFPAGERGKTLGTHVASVFIGGAMGQVLGGVLTQHLGWRSIFFLIVPWGLVTIGIVLWKLKGEWFGAKGEKFNFASSVIYSLALASLLYGFTRLPEIFGVCLIVVGVIGLLVFARREMGIRSPILDVNLFRNSRAFTFSGLAILIGFSPNFVVTFLISLYLQYVKGFTPEIAGLILVAMPAVMAIISPLAGKLSDRIEPRLIASAGMALNTVGLVMLVFLNEGTPLESVIGNLILMGFGLALVEPPNINAIMSSAPKIAYGVASATAATMRQIGSLSGMAVAVLMFSLYIGRVQITPEYYSLFQESMRTSFIVLAIICFAGIFVSLARGKVR